MFKIKIPIFYLFITILAGIGITLLSFNIAQNSKSNIDKDSLSPNAISNNFKIERLEEYKYTKPIISAEPGFESPRLMSLKEELNKLIENEEKDSMVSSVSVYVRDFEIGEWMVINEQTAYLPGSLLKVGLMTAWLKMSENKPGLLDKEQAYEIHNGFVFPTEHFQGKEITIGQKYKIREYLESMIVNSDNKAAFFLENTVDSGIFHKVFANLGIPAPKFHDTNYRLNVKDYSIFMMALFNSGFLAPKESEYAITLLTRSQFKEGLVKELPDSVVVAHKFGESGTEQLHELHETGLVYINHRPYLITVMTQGHDWARQSQIISRISKLTYDNMVGLKN